MKLDNDGNVVLTSPNGTEYKILVDNEGILYTEQVT